jgi:class 3 adenylate cyclase
MRTENLAVVFIDIVGFTARTSAQTREENERLLRRFEGTVRPLVRAWDGRVVKTIGDAFLVTFRSPTNALLCAMSVHDRLAETDGEVEPGARFAVRTAVNVGDVRIDGGDVFGEAVNVASRIEGQAGAGEIQFSEAVYLSMTRSEVPSEELGLVELKGIPGKVRIFRVPRAGDSGGYVISRGEAAAAGGSGEHRLAPPALPFGGLGLSRVRDRLEASTASQVLTPVADHARGLVERFPGQLQRLRARLERAWGWWRVEVQRSRKVQYATAIVAVALVALLAWALQKPKPQTPWQTFQRNLGL